MVSSDFGKLEVHRHFSSGIDCAMAGLATAVAATPTPAALRNSRRFMVFSPGYLVRGVQPPFGRVVIMTGDPRGTPISPLASPQPAVFWPAPVRFAHDLVRKVCNLSGS